MFLDWEQMLTVFSFVKSLKTRFDQIILTIRLENMLIEYDNKIIVQELHYLYSMK